MKRLSCETAFGL